MGVEYLVLDKKNERIFWLGKGPWYELMAENRHGYRVDGIWERAAALRVSEGAFIAMIEQIWSGYPAGDPPGHMTAVAKKLWRFCSEADWQVELTSDSGDYPYDWPEICTRYCEPCMEEDLQPDPLGGVGWLWNDPKPERTP
jgi:hypothetical protein